MGHLKSEGSHGSTHDGGNEEQEQTRFSAKVIDHGLRPKHRARMDQPDAFGDVCGWCGEVMEIFLRLAGDRITEATFGADGCISSMACGDMLTTMVEGLTLEQAAKITPDVLVAALGGLPYASVHCSELAITALKEALDDAESRKTRTDRLPIGPARCTITWR